MGYPFGVTATVERAPGTDRHGNTLEDADGPHEVTGCAIAPGGSTEAQGTELTVEWDLDLLHDDPAADFEAGDIVTLPGDEERYRVHGKPRRFRNPFTGWEAGVVVRLKGVDG